MMPPFVQSAAALVACALIGCAARNTIGPAPVGPSAEDSAAASAAAESSANARRAGDSQLQLTSAELTALDARFDKMWQARQSILLALQGKPQPEPRAKPKPPSRDEVLARCHDEALQLVDDELATIGRELDGREWELSPRTVLLRRNARRLQTLRAEVQQKTGP